MGISVKIKKLREDATIPCYAKVGDAGLDLVATHIISETNKQVTYGTGIALEIPDGHVGLIFPRSSIRKYDLELSNSVGVIDSGYRGEIQFTFNVTKKKCDISQHEHWSTEIYKVGDKIGQIIILPYPQVTLIESNELNETERGTGGFGSTGN